MILFKKKKQQQLSSNVVQGIHSIVQHMEISDYQSSLNLHSALVATSNFSGMYFDNFCSVLI
jgi:hypothetical protein